MYFTHFWQYSVTIWIICIRTNIWFLTVLHSVRSGGGVLFLIVRTFSIFSFVLFLLSWSQVTFSKLVPLACSLKPLTLHRLNWKSLSFLLILSHFLWRLFLSAITNVSLCSFTLFLAALKFSGTSLSIFSQTYLQQL